MLSSFPTVRGVRWLRALLWFLLSVLGLGLAQAEPKSPPGPLPALASGVPCGLLGDCARFDALGVHVGSTIGLAQRPSKSLALVGRTRVSVSMLDALEVSVSLGAQQGSTQQASASRVSGRPARLDRQDRWDASEAVSLLTDPNRKHIFKGEINDKRGKATGWHYEPTGNKEKGTYVLEETRSPPDPHGVYEGNVMIDGVKKDRRSTFFPKDWTEKQVESAIEEAYKARKPDREPGIYTGQTASGVEVEMQLTNNGQIHTAYPLYKGPKYKGPAR